MPSNLLQLNILLNGTGTEIPALNTSDNYNVYHIYGTAIAIGNYAIVPTGTLSPGLLYHFKYRGLLDITTNGTTFSLFGTSITAEQLLKDWEADCYYDGTSWEVVLKMDFSEANIISSSNLGSAITGANISNNSIDACTKLQNLSVCTGKINDLAVTTAKIDDLAVTDAKINDVNGSKLTNATVANSKLATMANNTIKANISGSTAAPSDVSIPTLLNGTAWGLTGNSGTIAGTNFIGTTDTTDLVFKIDNTESGRIGFGSTSFGLNSHISKITSYNNTCYGFASMQYTTAGSVNTGFGVNTLQHNEGFYNSAFGNAAGQSATTATHCTFLGNLANSSSFTPSYQIALGSGALSTLDYQFALPDNVLNLKLRGTNYVFPATDGTANQALTTDGSGVLSWDSLTQTQIVTVPISFESGEQFTNFTFTPPSSSKITKIECVVSKTLSGTDNGNVQITTNFGTNVITNITIPMSDLIDNRHVGVITYTSTITGVIEISCSKVTPGGKAILFISFDKA